MSLFDSQLTISVFIDSLNTEGGNNTGLVSRSFYVENDIYLRSAYDTDSCLTSLLASKLTIQIGGVGFDC